jgi:2-polyprenyl-3-methyl-5-hydroxy-6-metoxy-1,4-benzoquinol methylase
MVQGRTIADKYMQSAGIDRGWSWYLCGDCGLYFQKDPMPPYQLEKIYAHYRDQSIRDASIEDEFDRIMAIMPQESENYYRYRWFGSHYQGEKRLLDIGSGLGVWPYQIKTALGFDVQCVEPNLGCCDFINDSLNIPCICGYFYPEAFNETFDVVTIIHVLEHMLEPKQFLLQIKEVMHPKSQLFIEVPDSCEFECLELTNDEFNSCHLWFFNIQTLSTLVERAGYNVTHIHRVQYKQRNLSRILMLCNLE